MFRSYAISPLAVCTVVMLLTAVPSAFAETISLESGCTLNNAIRSAMTDSSVGDCRAGDPGRDHIYVVDTVKVVEPPVEVTEDLSVVGDRFTSTLDGQGRFSFFRVGPGVVVNLQDFFMSNGYGTRESGQIRVGSGGKVHLNTANIINCHGVKEIVAPSRCDCRHRPCSSVCGKSAPFNPHPPVSTPGKPKGKNDIPSKKRTKSRDFAPKSTQARRVYTCEHLPDDIIVRAIAGTRSGIQCQQIDARGVGIQSVIDAGLIRAVDVWGYVEPGVEVCMRGTGSPVFLDAATAPRRVSPIASFGDANWTCASFNRAGSLVLVRAGASQANAPSTPRPLTSCQVRAIDGLNFRNAPGGEVIIGFIPEGASLYASMRTAGWFQTTFNGFEGWISADYVETSASCD